MSILWRFTRGVVLIQFGMLVLFTAQGLLNRAPFSTGWWLILIQALALSGLGIFWPVRQAYVFPYLAAESILVLSLTYLDQEFMFLGFLLGPHAMVLLPLKQALFLLGGLAVLFEGVLVVRYGIAEVLYPGLALILGMFAFGYAYYQRERADEALAETRRLLDELRAAHQKLEAYAGQAQELAAAEERNRLARELHDSVKQQAFAASAQLGAARSLLRRDPAKAGDHLKQAERLMDELRGELAQLIHELRPVILQEKGLAQALREWGAGWSQQCGVALQIDMQGERRLAPETEQALFRIAQEALSNVARHSGASQARINLDYAAGQVQLSVKDDGLGFEAEHPAGGIGLRSMRERAERLPGGQLEIHSLPGQGTHVRVQCDG